MAEVSHTVSPVFPDDDAPHGTAPPQRAHEVGPQAGQPIGAKSTKVAWTLRDGDTIVAGFAWHLNPQAITRSHTTRSQLFGTKGGFYVDNFGPGPTTVQVSQLCASGKHLHGSELYTAREDVQRFIKNIYEPAVGNPQRFSVFFHDNHFERGFEERVYFPPNGLTIARSVDMHNVWRIDFTMIGLQKYPYAEVQAEREPQTKTGRRYRTIVVRRGDTLHKIAYTLAGKNNSPQRVKAIQARVIKLNPQLRNVRTVTINDPTGNPVSVTAKPLKPLPGEKLKVPA